MLGRDFFHNFHRQLVLVGCDVDGGEDRCKFVLRGGNLVVFGLGKNTEFPKFLVKFLHIFYHSRLDCAEVVVGKFLSLGRAGAEERASSIEEVFAFFVHGGVDEEVFLLGAYVDVDSFSLFAENGEKSQSLFVDCFHRAQERGFFVESVTVVGAERRRNA